MKISATLLCITTLSLLSLTDTVFANMSKEQCINGHDSLESWSDGCNNCSCEDNEEVVCTLMYCFNVYNNPLFKCDADNVGRQWIYNDLSYNCTAKGEVVFRTTIFNKWGGVLFTLVFKRLSLLNINYYIISIDVTEFETRVDFYLFNVQNKHWEILLSFVLSQLYNPINSINSIKPIIT